MSMRLKALEEYVQALTQSMNDLLTVLNTELPSTQPAMESFQQRLHEAEDQILQHKKAIVQEQAPFDTNGMYSSLMSVAHLKVLLKIYGERLKTVDPRKKIFNNEDWVDGPGFIRGPRSTVFYCGDFQRRSMQRPVLGALLTLKEHSAQYRETINLPVSGETIEWEDTPEGKFEYIPLIKYFNGLIDEYNEIVGFQYSLTHPIGERRDLEKQLCTALDNIVSMDPKHELQQEEGSISLQCYITPQTNFNIVLNYLSNDEFLNRLELELSIYYIQNEVTILSEKKTVRETTRGGFRFDGNHGRDLTPGGFSRDVHNDHMYSQLINAMVHYLRTGYTSTVYTYSIERGETRCHEHELIKLPIEEEEVESSGDEPDASEDVSENE